MEAPPPLTLFERAAADGRLLLPACRACGTLQYPLRDFCARCWCPEVASREVHGAGRVVAATSVLRTLDTRLREQLPLHIGSVRLDEGPLLWAFLPDAQCGGGERVHVRPRPAPGPLGKYVLEAVRAGHG